MCNISRLWVVLCLLTFLCLPQNRLRREIGYGALASALRMLVHNEKNGDRISWVNV